MANTFYSKSASRQKHNKKGLKTHIIIKDAVEKAVYVADPVLWIGVDRHNFFDRGKFFGFNSIWFGNKDLSVLLHAKCLVVCYADMYGKAVNAVNFACEYGIPVLWYHKHLPPEAYFWSFKCMIGNLDQRAFWEIVCNIV